MKKIFLVSALLLVTASTFAQGYRVNRTEEKRKVNIKSKKNNFGNNIISFTPAQAVVTNLYNEGPDVFAGISYERIMDNQLLSVRLPIYASLNNKFYYFMPQLKFYPTKQGAVRYAVGPQFLFGVGDVEYTKYNQGSGGIVYQQLVKDTRSQYGFLINNSLNFSVSKSLYVAMEVAMGLKFYDSHPNANNLNGTNVFGGSGATSQMFHTNFSVGYRF